MKTTRIRWSLCASLLFAMLCVALLAPFIAHAQASGTMPALTGNASAGPGTATVSLPDTTATALMNYLTPVIALILTGVANRFVPKIPNAVVPLIASAVGAGVNLLTAYSTGHPPNVWLGLLSGAAATTIHQVWTHAGVPNDSPYPSSTTITSIPPKSTP